MYFAIIPDEIGYCISDFRTSQGYVIEALHRLAERVVFCRVVMGVFGVRIPKALTNRKLPNEIVYKLEKLLKQFAWKRGF